MTDSNGDSRALDIFRRALDLDSDLRRDFVDRECAGSLELLQEVEELLGSADTPGMLDRPPTRWIDECADPVDDSLVGQQLGPYRLLEAIGRGGMGVVYLAEQREPIERRVAVKLVQPWIQNADVLSRFESERRALGLMSHPNIARVYDAGNAPDGRPFFVMEYVPGESIIDFADSQRLSIDERIELFTEVLDALQHAHQKGVIHRDIKPGNVLVGSAEGRPRVKVIDFGVAKAIDRRLTAETLHTAAGQIVGTLEYMSPEQCSIDRADEDTRSDLYSAALVLYELLVGDRPIDAERLRSSSLPMVHRMICEDDVPLPSTRARTVSDGGAKRRQLTTASLPKRLRGDLDAILLKGLDKALTRRYQSAIEFKEDLQNHLANRPISAVPPSTVTVVQKFVRRHRVGVAATALVFLALAVGLITAWLGLQEAREERIAAERALERERREARKARAIMGFLGETLLSASPETTRGRDDRVLVEMLEAAAARVEAALAEFPDGAVVLRTIIGRTLLSLGRLDDANEQLVLAEERYSELPDPAAYLTAELLHGRGKIAADFGHYIVAEQSFRSALQEAERSDPGDPEYDARRASVRVDLGWLMLQKEGLDEAGQLARDALALFAPSDPRRLGASNLLALVLKRQEKFVEAERIYRESLEQARYLGDGHPLIALLENNLGMLLLYDGRATEAEPYFQRSLEHRLVTYGEENPVLAESYNNLALAKMSTDQKSAAIPLFDRARTLLQREVDPMHPNLGSLAFNLAELYEETDQLPRAVEEYRRALTIDEHHFGDDHQYVAKDRLHLARAILRNGDPTTAEPIAIRSVDSYRVVPNLKPWHLARALTLRASCAIELRNFAIAEAALEEAHALVLDRPETDQFRLVHVRRVFAKLYDAWGRPDAAARWRETD